MTTLPKLLGQLPDRFRWSLHNLVAHPVCELLHQAGLARAEEWLHSVTTPG